MSSGFGNKVRVQIFGQSHTAGLGVVIDGLPPGEPIDLDAVMAFLAYRRGGKAFTTKRAEADVPRVLSGLFEGRTCGAPLCCVFENTDTRSGDYQRLIPRPSHADYNAYVKYKSANDYRGGGHFSGRLTLPLCFAGAVCMQILERRGITIGAHIAEIGGVQDRPYDPMAPTLTLSEFSVNDPDARARMLAVIENAAAAGDSVGGVVECAVVGVPQGLGEPMFDGVENRFASILFGIPAVRGIEFGAGFAAAKMTGSEHNDAYGSAGGMIRPTSNRAGGVLGGITTGLPILFRVAFKPTPSIAREQSTVDLATGENVRTSVTGRHDPCIVPRATPCVAAAAAVAVLDLMGS